MYVSEEEIHYTDLNCQIDCPRDMHINGQISCIE
jgi:hypothetical protein